MKKFIYILVAIIITNFFLPFGLIITANLIQKSVAEATENCTVVSAKWNPAGERPSDFYDDGTTGGDKTQGNIIVKTKNCVGQTDINLTIYESDGLTSLTDNTWDKSGLDNRVISIPSDNFTINMELGEEDCEARKGINDCALYFNLKKGSVTIYESYQKSSGILYYECDDACLTNADLLMVIPNGSDDEPVNMDAINPTSTPNTYELLAPIGTFKFAPDNIGEYFNTIFMIAIGLCGALAVIMIVLGGIQYMGDESVFGKTEAKSKIFAAILGLLIALGSYALLNTINPDFLNGGVHIDQVSAEIDEETETTPWEGTSSGDNLTLCPSGFEDISVPWGNPHKSLNVCKSIKPKVVEMLNEAKKAGILLSGSGSRTKAQQQQLREDHGCPDPTASSKKCNPETAKPGYSMHESGMAIDFRCNGQKMTKKSNCYVWLNDNAINYGGFKNLKSEPWHWSAGQKAGH